MRFKFLWHLEYIYLRKLMYEVNKYENFFSDKNSFKKFYYKHRSKKKKNEHLKAAKTYT